MHSPAGNNKGFSLIEIAIVMIIIGILAGTGMSMVGMLTKRKVRSGTVDYLAQAKAALINHARINGTLPLASADGDGEADDGILDLGLFPYLDLRLQPTDSHKRVLKYERNANLGTNRATSCNALQAGLAGNPVVVDADGSTSNFPVAAVLISSGPTDADGDGDLFDDITAGTHQGHNTDGHLDNYLRHPFTNDFDDLVVYITEAEIYGKYCEDVNLSVLNDSGATVYVYNQTLSAVVDNTGITDTEEKSYEVIPGSVVEIRDAPNGGGNLVEATPTLVGNDWYIKVE